MTPQPKQITTDEFAKEFKQRLTGDDPQYAPMRQFARQLLQDNKGDISSRQLVEAYQKAYPQQSQAFQFTDLQSTHTPAAQVPGGPPKSNVAALADKTAQPEHHWGTQFTDPKTPAGSAMTVPLVDRIPGARKTVEKWAPRIFGNYADLIPKEAQGGSGAKGAMVNAAKFYQGFDEGAADLAMDMTSPANMLLAAGSMMSGGTGKLGKIIGAVKKLASYGFRGQAAIDLVAKEFPDGEEAFKKGDFESLGKAVSRAMADVLITAEPAIKKVAGKVSSPKAAEVPPGQSPRDATPTPEGGKLYPKQAEKVIAARAKAGGKPAPKPVEKAPTDPAAIEKRIGDLQDEQNALQPIRTGGAGNETVPNPRFAEIEAEIAKLRQSHPAAAGDTLDPNRPAYFQRQAFPGTPQQPALPPEPVALTPEAAKARQAAAVARSSAPRTPVGDLGYRVAPEETGELPKRQPATSQPVRSEQPVPSAKPKAPAQQEIPDGTQSGAGSGPQSMQFTAVKVPGVPPGSTVIFREEVPGKGMQVDVVDSKGRVKKTILPFRDTLDNMVARGWIQPSKAVLPASPSVQIPKALPPGKIPMFTPGSPLPPPSPPPEPVVVSKPKLQRPAALPPGEVPLFTSGAAPKPPAPPTPPAAAPQPPAGTRKLVVPPTAASQPPTPLPSPTPVQSNVGQPGKLVVPTQAAEVPGAPPVQVDPNVILKTGGPEQLIAQGFKVKQVGETQYLKGPDGRHWVFDPIKKRLRVSARAADYFK